MKTRRRILSIGLGLLLLLSACKMKDSEDIKPDMDQVRNICELATVESYYHNVAKSEKPKGVGLSHIGESDRKFWIEYTGLARLGIDVADVVMKVDGDDVEIFLPKAKVLSISIDEDSWGEASFIVSQDGLNRNKISADDQTLAIQKAQEEMEKKVMEDDRLLSLAQNRAKKLIENYVVKLGESQGIAYNITWKLEGPKTPEPSSTEEGSL